jgi:cytochrome c oxidase subunit II
VFLAYKIILCFCGVYRETKALIPSRIKPSLVVRNARMPSPTSSLYHPVYHCRVRHEEEGMRRMVVLSLATSFLLASGHMGSVQASAQGQSDPPRVIEVTAKKYEFSPDEIRVKRGEKVRLKIHSVDENHGMKVSVYPEGNKDKSAPGLILANPQENGGVDKGHEQILEFVADRAGTYDFKCAVMCGVHHGRMKGKLIVEE